MTPAGPSRLWYVAALAFFAVSLLPAVLLGRHAASAVDVDVEPLEGSSVATGPEEQALWVDAAASTSEATCQLRRGGSGSTFIVELDASTAALTRSDDGRSWMSIAIVPADDPTAWRLNCSDESGRLAPQELALSANPRVRSFAGSLVLAFVIPLVAAVVASVVAIAVAVRRRRAGQAQSADASYLPPPAAN